jgi:glycosyltransferase involved in cell wall biosynthesis
MPSASSLPTRKQRQRRPRLTVVIPAKNEGPNIGWVLGRLPTVVDEVVLVDGHSTDDTVAVARAIRPDVVVVTESCPGKGAALRAGVEAARGVEIVMIDADGSMDPLQLHDFIRALRDGHDVVKGSRFLPGGGTADMTAVRDIGHRCLLTLANFLFRTSHTDLCYGYAAFTRSAFLGLELTSVGFEIETELFLRAVRTGLRVTEVASFEAPRRAGNSNLNTFRDGWRVLRTMLKERRLAFAPRPLAEAALGEPALAEPARPQLARARRRSTRRNGRALGGQRLTASRTPIRRGSTRHAYLD